MKIVVLLTGLPGVGKTTAVEKILQQLKSEGKEVHGFCTREVRLKRERIGFDIVTMDNNRGVLSRTGEHFQSTLRPAPMVSKYMVNLDDLERISLPELDHKQGYLIIDEIGKMELTSKRFADKIEECLNRPDVRIIGTIPQQKPGQKGNPLLEKIRGDERIHIIEVTRTNRDQVPKQVLDLMIGEAQV